MNNNYKKGGGQDNKTSRLTLRSPNFKNVDKNTVKNFSKNNPYFKMNATFKRISKLNSLRATKRNNKNSTYFIKKMEPTSKGEINTFKKILVSKQGKINKVNKPNKATQLYPTTFNLNLEKHNLLQEANIQRIPKNNNSISSYATQSTNNPINRTSINSRSTINTNSITNYKQKGIKYINPLVYSHKTSQQHKPIKFGNKFVKSWRGHTVNNNNNNNTQSISSYNEEKWTNNNLNNM